ncbi:MAG: FtsX-like permease family protein, partial [Chloroflexi bacterium]|nr:FtsX-like permease family protein [Chloroflexota bacterium]
ALRLGLGASNRDLLRQFAAEGLVLATLGAIVGIGLAVAILDAVVALAPDGIARIASASIDGRSLLFAAACLVAVTLAIGCVPLMAVGAPSIEALLRGRAAGVGGSTRAARFGSALLTVEVAGTAALLIVAGALTVSFLNLHRADLGFDRESVLTAFVNPSRVRYPDAAARRRFFRDVIARLGANAEVGDVFLPYTQTAIPLRYVVVRTTAGPAAARAVLRRALAEVDPEQPMSADLTTAELVERALSRERFQSALLLPFGVGSALLAALGVFGMVSDTANRRLRELALRQALGARRSRVLAELLRSTLACVLAGLCAGALLAIAASRALSLELFEIGLADPWIVVAVCSLILGVSVVACIGPAARVGRLDVGAMLRE